MVAIVPGALVSRREGNSSEAREMGGRQRLDQAGPCRLWQGIGCYSQKRGIHGIQSLEPGRDGSGYGGGGGRGPAEAGVEAETRCRRQNRQEVGSGQAGDSGHGFR